jgi:hypothetical protein
MTTISLSGLNLDFMKSNPLPKVRRKKPKIKPCKRSDIFGIGAYIMPDLDVAYSANGGGFRSPIDGSFITSRKQLRDHNRAHGVIQSGDVKPEQAREHNLRKMQHDPSAKSDPNFAWVNPTRR